MTGTADRLASTDRPAAPPATVRDPHAPAAEHLRALHDLVRHATGLDLPVRLWNGEELGARTAPWRLVLGHPWSLRAMLVPPTDNAAGEAYVRGDIDVEGDIVAGIAAARRAMQALADPTKAARVARHVLALPRPPHREDGGRRAALSGARHDPERDREAISFHYDLPDEFYATFLDEAMVYSCGYFADDDPTDLDRAQRRKLDLVCRKLRLRPGSRILDIGCGWGSLLEHAARHYGARGVGVTLSATQTEAANRRLAAAGLDDRVEVVQRDYRELVDDPAVEPFDAVCSIGMVEHVGAAHLPEYFAACRELTADGGLTLTHGIVRQSAPPPRPRRHRTFIQRHVFPDGELVRAADLIDQLEQADLGLLDVQQLRPHYALTLRQWVARLEANEQAAVALAGQQAYRTWRLYMAGSAEAFASRSIGVVQLLAGKQATVPLSRGWMDTSL